MKHLILLFIVQLILTTAQAQKFVRIDHPSCQIKTNSSDHFKGIGTFVVGRGGTCDPSGQELLQRNFITLLDSNGVMQWQKSIDLHYIQNVSQNCDKTVDVKWTKDTCALVAMYSLVQADFGDSIWSYNSVLVSKWDRFGNNLWANDYTIGKQLSQYNTIQIVNDTLFHIPFRTPIYDSIATFLEFNTNGEVTDTFALRFNDTSAYFNQYSNISSIAYPTGERFYCGSLGAKQDLVLSKTLGNTIEWSKRIEFNESLNPVSFVQSNREGSIYVLGQAIGSNYVLSVTKLSSSGNVIWSSSLDAGYDGSRILLYDKYVIIESCPSHIQILDTLSGTDLSVLHLKKQGGDPTLVNSINNIKIKDDKILISGSVHMPEFGHPVIKGFIMENDDSLLFCHDSLSQSYTTPLTYTYHTINPTLDSIALQVHPYTFTVDTIQALATIDQCSVHLNISDKKGNQLQVYPNPSRDFLYIKTENNAQGLLQIFNISGQLVFNSEVSESTKLNISEWDAGLYTIKLIDRDGSESQDRLIKLN